MDYTGIIISIITIIAIIIGPISSVIITRKMDEEREKRERKLDVFRTLMKTRPIRLAPSHVESLNLIELEFYGNKEVITPYREYIKHLSSPLPATKEQGRYDEERHDLFVGLLQALGRVLGYTFDKRELERLSYAPQGWEQDESTQKKNAYLLTELLEGRRPLPVTNMVAPADNPYPPPPLTK